MAEVVILSWDPTARILEFVEINDGSGGAVTAYTVGADFVDDVAHQCASAELPQVGELLAYPDGACGLELNGPRAVLCSARRPKKGPPQVRLAWNEGIDSVLVPPGDVGLDDPDMAQHAERIGRFLLFLPPGRRAKPIGCWVRPGGLAGWHEERRRQRAERTAREEALAARRATEEAERLAKAKADQSFVNPYTFVPFPESIAPDEPAGHRALAPGRLSGVFRVRWEFTSPFQAPDGAVTDGRLRLPGSSVKGALRSLHETLAGGCLRVFDQDFVPSYRDSARVPPPAWSLAVVEDVADGQPLTVRVCDTVVWVRVERLHEAVPASKLATGSRVSFSHHAWTEHLGRLELDDEVTITRDGDWVVLLSDPGARPQQRRSKDGKSTVPGVYFAACGRLAPTAEPVRVDEQAWRTFRVAVTGAREVQVQRRRQREGQRSDATTDRVEFPGKRLVGRRKIATGWFDEEDVLWAHRADGASSVDGIRLAAIWRHVGAGPMRERVPRHLHPCEDPASLCPSCRIFGSADTSGREPDDTARQRAYAGHVRLGDAVSPEPVTLRPFKRAPMGVPRAGAGQFYLRYDDPGPAKDEKDRPTREWGAKPDTPAPRPLRGRKYYWHADPAAQSPPRYEARPHQSGSEMADKRSLALPGTVLVQTVTFDNLGPAELGGLLATFEPQRVLPEDAPGTRELRLHLGGGKPLGMGSCRATVEGLRVWTAESRYGDAPEVEPDLEGYLAEFHDATPPEVRATWPALTATLGETTVDAERVWYPPGAYWSERPTEAETDQLTEPELRKAHERFDSPFDFFKVTAGEYLKTGQRPMRPLPEPTDADLTLRIVPKPEGGRGGRRDAR